MKILVTGANGYIGAKVVRKLCDDGCEVIACDLFDNNIDKRATFVQANILQDDKNWYQEFCRPQVCLHLAWKDGFVHNSPQHMADLSRHYAFLCNLIENGLPQLVVMGTMHEVGYWEGAIDENTPCNPSSLYGVAKNALRKSLEIFTAANGCAFQWLRAFYIFGDDAYGNSIFCKLRQAVKDGKSSFPFTTGKNQYDFIHVDDLASAISKCVRQNEVNGIINVCSGQPKSLAEQVEWYIAQNQLPIALDYGKFPDRAYDSPCVYGDDSKLKKIEASFENR